MTFPLWWAPALALVTFALALLATPLVREWSSRLGFFDHPGTRKVHTAPMLRQPCIIFWLQTANRISRRISGAWK